jgi:hypothetical protein
MLGYKDRDQGEFFIAGSLRPSYRTTTSLCALTASSTRRGYAARSRTPTVRAMGGPASTLKSHCAGY